MEGNIMYKYETYLTPEEKEVAFKEDLMIDNSIEFIRDLGTNMWNCGRNNELDKIREINDEIEKEILKLIRNLRIKLEDKITYR
jgi:hypothetical protein